MVRSWQRVAKQRDVRVNLDAKVTNRRCWSRTKRADGRTNNRPAMLTTVRCAPHELRLVTLSCRWLDCIQSAMAATQLVTTEMVPK